MTRLRKDVSSKSPLPRQSHLRPSHLHQVLKAESPKAVLLKKGSQLRRIHPTSLSHLEALDARVARLQSVGRGARRVAGGRHVVQLAL